MRICGLPANTRHTEDGGGNSSGEIFATRQRISQAITDSTAKPSGSPTIRPSRHAASPPPKRTGVGAVSWTTAIEPSPFGGLGEQRTSFETGAAHPPQDEDIS